MVVDKESKNRCDFVFVVLSRTVRIADASLRQFTILQSRIEGM